LTRRGFAADHDSRDADCRGFLFFIMGADSRGDLSF
jgi:hypothetical protein